MARGHLPGQILQVGVLEFLAFHIAPVGFRFLPFYIKIAGGLDADWMRFLVALMRLDSVAGAGFRCDRFEEAGAEAGIGPAGNPTRRKPPAFFAR